MSSSEVDSDSSAGSNVFRHADLSETVFKSYVNVDESNRGSSVGLDKVQSILTSSASGGLSCLICLERIRPTDPTWSCTEFCYSVFHLVCIQSWARQASFLAAERVSARLPVSHAQALQSASWNCPKCRSSYPASVIPRQYLCFCGKVEDPPSDNPWIVPHSCGDVCARPLRDRCGHHCLLLCHPGPCPSCPQVVTTKCFCGKAVDVRRCGSKGFSCGQKCGKPRSCGAHPCEESCHEGECTVCLVRGVYKCQCGKEVVENDCNEREKFQCGHPCNELLPCGRHRCEKGCHPPGKCGECGLQGRRTCPCGKMIYEGVPCDADLPPCGSTCEKLLSCGYHRCHDRCHRGSCIETCRIVVNKICRCGGLKKEVPCYQDLSCDRKCQKVRDCGRHACKRRCCDGDCPPCGEICDKRLRCKNHKCPAPCHRGACAPCPLMVTISCACGGTHFEVPCGTEIDQKPPRCRKLCNISPLCKHGSSCKLHKCHYGPCPPCRLICDEEYPCGHKCKLSCHGPRPLPKPEFTLKPKKKKVKYQPTSLPGSSCPPCSELVWNSCVGQHFGADRMMVCSKITKFSCDNLCGNPLSCGNHYCTKGCHALEGKLPCEVCDLPCKKARSPPCQHACPMQCHPGECPPCKVLVKRGCHCGAMVHVFECLYFNSMPEEKQIAVRSCVGPCHRKLRNCTHLCPETCHAGECPSPEKCSKKVIVRCSCQTLKKEWQCHDVQAAYHKRGSDPKDVTRSHFGVGLLDCNSDCKKRTQIVESELRVRNSNDLEVNPPLEENVRKRRKRPQRIEAPKPTSASQRCLALAKRIIFVLFLMAILIAVAHYGYTGLIWVSDRMNEVEEQRQTRRHPRF